MQGLHVTECDEVTPEMSSAMFLGTPKQSGSGKDGENDKSRVVTMQMVCQSGLL